MTNQNDTQDEAERMAKEYDIEKLHSRGKIRPQGSFAGHDWLTGYRAGVASLDNKIGHLQSDLDYYKNKEMTETASHLYFAKQKVEAELTALRSELEVMKSRASQFESTLKETMRIRDEAVDKYCDLVAKYSELADKYSALREELAISNAHRKTEFELYQSKADSLREENERLKSFGWRVDLANLKSQLAAEKQKAQNLVEAIEIWLASSKIGGTVSALDNLHRVLPDCNKDKNENT